MIRARESLDRYAHAAIEILDQVRSDPGADGTHVKWALAYLGDRAGSTRIPVDLRVGYDSKDAAIDALLKTSANALECHRAAA